MLLRESDKILRPKVEDAIVMDDSDDSSLSSASSSPRQSEDNASREGTVTSVLSDVNGNKNARTKKRVQFLPDGVLVRIRVIPPRSNKSSSDSDGSASDSSDSEESDSETVTDSEDFSSDRDTPSPAVPTESKNKFATMPPLVYAAKGSYSVSKSNNKNGLLVAKITGINRPSSPAHSSIKAKRNKRIGSPKIDRVKKAIKTNLKTENRTRSPDDNKIKGRKKRMPLKFKEGKLSPPPSTKSNKTQSIQKTPIKLSQRRLNNSSNIAKSNVTNKRSQTPSVSTSVKSLVIPQSSASPEISLDRVSRAMQSLSMGKLYTVDGFIFPPHHANDLHLPDLAFASKSEDFEYTTSVDIHSPRRSFQGNPRQQSNNQIQPQISPTSANRKRRYYAWQMANGSIHSTLNNTPNISQLWDNISVHSEPLDKTCLDSHKHM